MPQSGVPLQFQQTAGALSNTQRANFASGIHRGSSCKSWVNPDAKKRPVLLYVSDAVDSYSYGQCSEVEIFDYRHRDLLGEASGFDGPEGECSDRNGDVYVVDYDDSKTVEFAYGNTTPMKTLSDGVGAPIGCSVNPKNGDLAVTNYCGYYSSDGCYSSSCYCPGNVLIYKGGSGNPTRINAAGVDWPAGYDPNGNLFIEGFNYPLCARNRICVGELPSGGGSFEVLNLSGATISWPSAVEWDGKYLGLGDQGYDLDQWQIHQATLSVSTLTVVSTTDLSVGTDCTLSRLTQWAFYSKKPNDLPKTEATQVAAGGALCYYSGKEHDYGIWAYPVSGDNPPVAHLHGRKPRDPDGQTIVAKPT